MIKRGRVSMFNMDNTIAKESPLFYLKKDLASSTAARLGVSLCEVPNNAYFVLRGDKSAAHLEQALYKHLKLYLPQNTREMARNTNAAIYYVSFDEWLIVVDEDEFARVDTCLRADLSGHVQLVDTSGGMTQLNMQGEQVHVLLQKLCGYDFHPSRFVVGTCVQTRVAKSSGLVVRTGEFAFAMYIRRSFADYIANWCLDAV